MRKPKILIALRVFGSRANGKRGGGSGATVELRDSQSIAWISQAKRAERVANQLKLECGSGAISGSKRAQNAKNL